MSNHLKKWLIFSILCLVWGSSFILIKWGMYGPSNQRILTAWQVGALRIFSAAIVLLPFGIRAICKIPRKIIPTIILSGILGNFLPAFLICLAETKIGSALTGMLNALTPLFVLLVGVTIYKIMIPRHQVLGVVLGFLGCIWLFITKMGNANQDIRFSAFVILATLCYGLNVNLVRSKLKTIGAVDTAAIAFLFLLPLSTVILYFTGFFSINITQTPYLRATIAVSLLGVVGTAFASIIFYQLVKLAGQVFSSMVTYGIPFVAIGWGLAYGETINWQEMAALLVILTGVYLTSFGLAGWLKWGKVHKAG